MQTKKAEIFFRYFLNQHWAKPYSIVIFFKKKKSSELNAWSIWSKMKLKMNLDGKLLQILTTFPEKYFLCHDLAFSNFAVSNFQKTIMTS